MAPTWLKSVAAPRRAGAIFSALSIPKKRRRASRSNSLGRQIFYPGLWKGVEVESCTDAEKTLPPHMRGTEALQSPIPNLSVRHCFPPKIFWSFPATLPFFPHTSYCNLSCLPLKLALTLLNCILLPQE